MTLDHRQQALQGIRATLSVVVYPLQYLVNIPFAVGDWASETLKDHNSLLADNRTLRARELEAQVSLLKLAALERENARLRSLLQSSSRRWERVLVAEMMSIDFDPFKHQILLNKGSNDGVFEGQPLIDAAGVMGQVLHVSPFTSTAMLITDPSHAIPVQVNRNGVRAIAVGTGDPAALDIPHIPNNADIQEGDLLITSGLGQRFPAGYPVAEIVLVERNPAEPFATITAVPLAHLDRSQEVLLVWPEKEEAAE